MSERGAISTTEEWYRYIGGTIHEVRHGDVVRVTGMSWMSDMVEIVNESASENDRGSLFLFTQTLQGPLSEIEVRETIERTRNDGKKRSYRGYYTGSD